MSKKIHNQQEVMTKLLMFIAVLNGASSKDLAKVTGVGERRIQQLVPMKKSHKK